MVDRDKKVRAFICGIAWQHELGETDVRLYPTKETLLKSEKKHFLCDQDCGIVEVEVKFVRWARKQKLGRVKKKK